MSLMQEIRAVSTNLDTTNLLRFLIEEKFPGKLVVTASLKAASIVVLKLVADVDPATPIIFCHPNDVFPESVEFREQIVTQLGLQNISTSLGHETDVRPGDHDHCEKMWAYYRNQPGRSFEIVHLNDTLAPYDCWISAVYHMQRPASVQQRIDIEGRIIRVDLLNRWTKDDVRQFMRKHNLPYHKLATRRFAYPQEENTSEPPFYGF